MNEKLVYSFSHTPLTKPGTPVSLLLGNIISATMVSKSFLTLFPLGDCRHNFCLLDISGFFFFSFSFFCLSSLFYIILLKLLVSFHQVDLSLYCQVSQDSVTSLDFSLFRNSCFGQGTLSLRCSLL